MIARVFIGRLSHNSALASVRRHLASLLGSHRSEIRLDFDLGFDLARAVLAFDVSTSESSFLIAATGLRASECLGLKWADIDYENQQIHVRCKWTGGKVGKPKSKASKAPVPMVPLLAGFHSPVARTDHLRPADRLDFCEYPSKGQTAPCRQHAGGRLSPTCCVESGCAERR